MKVLPNLFRSAVVALMVLPCSVALSSPAGDPAAPVFRPDAALIEQPFDCPRASGPITVDGSLDDWPELPLACRSPAMIEGESVYHAGSADASFRFATAHDEAFLYLAVETTDDHAAVFSDTPPGRRDAVTIHLDARPDPDRSTGSRLWNKQLRLFLPFEITAGPTPDAPLITPGFPDDRLPAGAKTACARTALGLRVEIAIPVAWLNEKQGGPWNAFRLNIAQLDIDDAPAPRIGIWWRPRWESPQNFYGSGTFVRK